MAVFTILGTLNWNSYADTEGGTILRHTAKMLQYVSDTGFKVTLHGHGFRYDAAGLPTAGVITGLDVYKNGAHLAHYTGLTTPLADYVTLGLGQTSGLPDSATDMEALYAILRSGYDMLNGNDLGKAMSGYDGNDTIFGNGGDDWLSGGRGVDTYYGGTGLNGIFFEDGVPPDHGIKVNFTLTVGNIVDDGYGNTETATGIQLAEGTSFGDRFTGGFANEAFYGLGGNDTLIGGFGDDTVAGGSGVDAHYGGDGYDQLDFYRAAAGVVVNLSNAPASQILNDGYGNRELATGFEAVQGSAFADSLTGDALGNTFWGDNGNDTLVGNGGSDWLYGNAGVDLIYGGDGDDDIEGDKGADATDGGAGFDRIGFWDIDATGHGATVDLSRIGGQIIDDGYGNIETALNIERLAGSGYGDVFTGNAVDNILWGEGGADRLYGGDGNDELYGGTEGDILNGGFGDDLLLAGAGNDGLTGGAGADAFWFIGTFPSDDGTDHIADFQVGVDVIIVNINWTGDFTANRFVSGFGITEATTPEQRVIYNTQTGGLYADFDGLGGMAAALIAVLDNHAALTFADVFSGYPF